MADEPAINDPVAEVPPEQRPLLGDNQDGDTDNGTIERQAEHDESNGHGEDDIGPLAEEPDTRKLALVMGSMWVGVFMNALGTVIAPLCARASS